MHRRPKKPAKKNTTSEITQDPSTDHNTDLQHSIPNSDPQLPGRICVISSNNKNTILRTAEKTFAADEICHYLTPGAGILRLLEGIDSKLKNFTFKDFCFVFVGIEDFHDTHDYQRIIESIREKLMLIKHTNIIICSPTYKLNKRSNLVNKRIQHFNDLLYTDAVTYKYAFILDSCKNLPYSQKMFCKKTGFINNRALSIIFNDLDYYVTEINSYYSHSMLPNCLSHDVSESLNPQSPDCTFLGLIRRPQKTP
jgi:hypothetical protein